MRFQWKKDVRKAKGVKELEQIRAKPGSYQELKRLLGIRERMN